MFQYLAIKKRADDLLKAFADRNLAVGLYTVEDTFNHRMHRVVSFSTQAAVRSVALRPNADKGGLVVTTWEDVTPDWIAQLCRKPGDLEEFARLLEAAALRYRSQESARIR